MTETKTAKVTPVAEMQQTKAKQIKHLPAKRETPAKSKSVAEMQQAKAELVQTTWAKRVKKHWDDAEMYAKKSAEAFLACGDCLLQAKEAMDPDAFTAMIRVALPFDEVKGVPVDADRIKPACPRQHRSHAEELHCVAHGVAA